tara:strand:+ start:489 stop:680 length:192 start_codon:yes stop_codon:yes gene_type:complete
MKLVAILDKFNRLSPQSIPCDVVTRKGLAKGLVVDVGDDVAKELLAMNIVEENKSKKTKKESK